MRVTTTKRTSGDYQFRQPAMHLAQVKSWLELEAWTNVSVSGRGFMWKTICFFEYFVCNNIYFLEGFSIVCPNAVCVKLNCVFVCVCVCVRVCVCVCDEIRLFGVHLFLIFDTDSLHIVCGGNLSP